MQKYYEQAIVLTELLLEDLKKKLKSEKEIKSGKKTIWEIRRTERGANLHRLRILLNNHLLRK